MNVGDKVLLRRYDAGEVWIFAIVQDPATGRVQVQHPGNAEDGKVILAAPADLRTKADIQNVLSQAQPIAAAAGPRGLTDAQLRQLGALDGFWLQYLHPDQQQTRITVHKLIAKHYTVVMSQLT